MIKSYKVRLEPNNGQQTIFRQYSGAARWVYNWVLTEEKKYYEETGKFLAEFDLGKRLTDLKKQREHEWLSGISRQTIIFAARDAANAYRSFFKKRAKYPRFKSRKNAKQAFYSRYDKIKIANGFVKMERIGRVRLSEKDHIPQGKYSNPRVTFDGLHWYLSIGVEVEPKNNKLTNVAIGIDLGLKELAIISDGAIIPNINKTLKMKRLEQRKKKLQRKISKKYIKNKKGVCYVKTSNIKKLEKKVKKLCKKIANIRIDFIHKATTEIARTKPSRVVMEDLNVKGMMKNHKLAKSIQDQTLSEFKRQMKYKCQWSGIELIEADRWYPSSKTCSGCGHIKPRLSLSERVYKCEHCGLVIDRDLNAAINLANYEVA
jgi:putative transposase